MTAGTVELYGNEIHIKNPSQAYAQKIGFIPESRREESLFALQSNRFNMTIRILKEFIQGVFVNRKKEEDIVEDVYKRQLYTKADYNAAKESGVKGAEVSALITAGLGGKANIEDVDCCATRLRCTIKDPAKVQEALLKQSGDVYKRQLL